MCRENRACASSTEAMYFARMQIHTACTNVELARNVHLLHFLQLIRKSSTNRVTLAILHLPFFTAAAHHQHTAQCLSLYELGEISMKVYPKIGIAVALTLASRPRYSTIMFPGMRKLFAAEHSHELTIPASLGKQSVHLSRTTSGTLVCAKRFRLNRSMMRLHSENLQ